MKELDILLERFLAENERTLLEGGWPELEGLLETEDDILWDWFQNPEAVASGPYGKLLKAINRVPG
jgi:succinate dehydrogenase flavin-adding protein (antitoxin of CptAB toxin-antitoxin module)